MTYVDPEEAAEQADRARFARYFAAYPPDSHELNQMLLAFVRAHAPLDRDPDTLTVQEVRDLIDNTPCRQYEGNLWHYWFRVHAQADRRYYAGIARWWVRHQEHVARRAALETGRA